MKIAFDATLMRPGCVLIQAALGGDSTVAHLFPLDSWLLAPTDDMKVYETTPEQAERLVEMTKMRLETVRAEEEDR